jgi:hypothetical protein
VECETTTGSSTVCEACGSAGQPCCSGSTCVGSSLVCSTSTATPSCLECGGAGEPCCTASDAGVCGSSLACRADLRCP